MISLVSQRRRQIMSQKQTQGQIQESDKARASKTTRDFDA